MPNTPPIASYAALREAIRAEALRRGFGLAGFTTAEPLGEPTEARWLRWRRRGVQGVMSYLTRPVPRRTHPRDLLPEAQSALIVAAGYYDGDHPTQRARTAAAPNDEQSQGKIARYAWGRDYHHVVREELESLAAWIASESGSPLVSRVCVDSAPLDERALAVRAGLGFIGKNTLLVHPERGSWAVLGVLLLSLPLPADNPMHGATASCGSCRRCIEACPTAAFTGPYTLDPRRCISYLTIEQREPIPQDLAARQQGWAFGCDICQEVCPLNHTPLTRLLPGLAAAEGAGPHLTDATLDGLTSGNSLRRRWGHTPLARPGLAALRRNLRALADHLRRD